jgi:hypothetical protein
VPRCGQSQPLSSSLNSFLAALPLLTVRPTQTLENLSTRRSDWWRGAFAPSRMTTPARRYVHYGDSILLADEDGGGDHRLSFPPPFLRTRNCLTTQSHTPGSANLEIEIHAPASAFCDPVFLVMGAIPQAWKKNDVARTLAGYLSCDKGFTDGVFVDRQVTVGPRNKQSRDPHAQFPHLFP